MLSSFPQTLKSPSPNSASPLPKFYFRQVPEADAPSEAWVVLSQEEERRQGDRPQPEEQGGMPGASLWEH